MDSRQAAASALGLPSVNVSASANMTEMELYSVVSDPNESHDTPAPPPSQLGKKSQIADLISKALRTRKHVKETGCARSSSNKTKGFFKGWKSKFSPAVGTNSNNSFKSKGNVKHEASFPSSGHCADSSFEHVADDPASIRKVSFNACAGSVVDIDGVQNELNELYLGDHAENNPCKIRRASFVPRAGSVADVESIQKELFEIGLGDLVDYDPAIIDVINRASFVAYSGSGAAKRSTQSELNALGLSDSDILRIIYHGAKFFACACSDMHSETYQYALNALGNVLGPGDNPRSVRRTAAVACAGSVADVEYILEELNEAVDESGDDRRGIRRASFAACAGSEADIEGIQCELDELGLDEEFDDTPHSIRRASFAACAGSEADIEDIQRELKEVGLGGVEDEVIYDRNCVGGESIKTKGGERLDRVSCERNASEKVVSDGSEADDEFVIIDGVCCAGSENCKFRHQVSDCHSDRQPSGMCGLKHTSHANNTSCHVPDIPIIATCFADTNALFTMPVPPPPPRHFLAHTPAISILGGRKTHRQIPVPDHLPDLRCQKSYLSSFMESGNGDFKDAVEKFHAQCFAGGQTSDILDKDERDDDDSDETESASETALYDNDTDEEVEELNGDDRKDDIQTERSVGNDDDDEETESASETALYRDTDYVEGATFHDDETDSALSSDYNHCDYDEVFKDDDDDQQYACSDGQYQNYDRVYPATYPPTMGPCYYDESDEYVYNEEREDDFEEEDGFVRAYAHNEDCKREDDSEEEDGFVREDLDIGERVDQEIKERQVIEDSEKKGEKGDTPAEDNDNTPGCNCQGACNCPVIDAQRRARSTFKLLAQKDSDSERRCKNPGKLFYIGESDEEEAGAHEGEKDVVGNAERSNEYMVAGSGEQFCSCVNGCQCLFKANKTFGKSALTAALHSVENMAQDVSNIEDKTSTIQTPLPPSLSDVIKPVRPRHPPVFEPQPSPFNPGCIRITRPLVEHVCAESTIYPDGVNREYQRALFYQYYLKRNNRLPGGVKEMDIVHCCTSPSRCRGKAHGAQPFITDEDRYQEDLERRRRL